LHSFLTIIKKEVEGLKSLLKIVNLTKTIQILINENF